MKSLQFLFFFCLNQKPKINKKIRLAIFKWKKFYFQRIWKPVEKETLSIWQKFRTQPSNLEKNSLSLICVSIFIINMELYNKLKLFLDTFCVWVNIYSTLKSEITLTHNKINACFIRLALGS